VSGELTNEPDGWQLATSNLSGGGTVTFDVPDTTVSDSAHADPIVAWLRVFPTADETAPD
jgi:hypothetical protein